MSIDNSRTSSSPARGYAEIVNSKNAEKLIPVIQRIVGVGTEIHTDEWSAYSGLSEIGYIHKCITRKYNFNDPITGIHTQNVESFNKKLKLFIKTRNGCKAGYHKYIIQYFLFLDHRTKFIFEVSGDN